MLFLSSKHYGRNFFYITIINCVVTLLCIYMIVGCRVILVMLNPNTNINVNSDNLKEFIPIQLTKMRYKQLINQLNSFKPSSKKVVENSQINKSYPNSTFDSTYSNSKNTFAPNTSTYDSVNDIK